MKIDPSEIENYYFPVNVSLFERLVGKMLTHVEAMNLPPAAEKANKDLVRQSLWKWWADAQENSMTSWKGCIGPINYVKDPKTSDQEAGYYWRTDVGMIAPTANVTVSVPERAIGGPPLS